MAANFLEDTIFTTFAPRAIRFISPVAYSQAEGLVRQVYEQMRRDFQIVPPLTIHSPIPELLAGVWAVIRETLIAGGSVSRAAKEVIASSVSKINECPYCVDIHASMLHGASEHESAVAILKEAKQEIRDEKMQEMFLWASATLSVQSAALIPPFSEEEAPECIGTALSFHYINRMVNVFLKPSPMLIPSFLGGIKGFVLRAFGSFVGKRIVSLSTNVKQGASLHLLPKAELPEEFAWARSNESISGAFARLASVMRKIEEQHVPQEVRELVEGEAEQWNGEQKVLNSRWVDDVISNLNDDLQPAARLALLTTLSSYQVDEGTVEAFRRVYPSDDVLVGITAWASYSAMRRISMRIHGQ
jgi:AhpD family alkylhydroperoxidase